MNFAKLAWLLVSLTCAFPCFAENTGGGGVVGLTVLKQIDFFGSIREQKLNLPAKYLGQIGSIDVIKARTEDFESIQRSNKSAGVLIRTTDNVIRSFIMRMSEDGDSISLKTSAGEDIIIVKDEVEVDDSVIDQAGLIEELSPE